MLGKPLFGFVIGGADGLGTACSREGAPMRNNKDGPFSDSLRNLHRSLRRRSTSVAPRGAQRAIAGLSLAVSPAFADDSVKLPFASGPLERADHAWVFRKKATSCSGCARRCLRLRWTFSTAACSPRTTSSEVRWHWAVIPN